jgi:hypothetical protein
MIFTTGTLTRPAIVVPYVVRNTGCILYWKQPIIQYLLISCSDDGDESLKEVSRVPLVTSTTARQVPAPDSDITSLQSHCLLDGAAGVELNRIGSVSVTTNNLMDSQTVSYNELVSGVRDQPDVPLLIPTAEFRGSMDSLNMDCDEDAPLLIPDCESPSRNTNSNETRG